MSLNIKEGQHPVLQLEQGFPNWTLGRYGFQQGEPKPIPALDEVVTQRYLREDVPDKKFAVAVEVDGKVAAADNYTGADIATLMFDSPGGVCEGIPPQDLRANKIRITPVENFQTLYPDQALTPDMIDAAAKAQFYDENFGYDENAHPIEWLGLADNSCSDESFIGVRTIYSADELKEQEQLIHDGVTFVVVAFCVTVVLGRLRSILNRGG